MQTRSKYSEALECFDKVLKINSKNAEALGNKGRVLGKLDRKHEGIDCLNISLKLQSDPEFEPSEYKKNVHLPGNPNEDTPLQSMIRKSSQDAAFADMFFKMFKR